MTAEKVSLRKKTTRGVASASKRVRPEVLEQDAHVEVRIPSDLKFVRVVRLAVSGVASMMPFTYDDIEDIKLAVSEACNNAIIHANDRRGGEEVIIQLSARTDRLCIAIEDHGAGIPPDKRQEAARPPEALEERGLGLFLIQALMDEVNYETSDQTGTRVQMVKRVPRTLRSDARKGNPSNDPDGA